MNLRTLTNGFTIIAAEFSARKGFYIVVGVRRQEDGTYTYATGCMSNLGLDPEWFWGRYDFTVLSHAGDDMRNRL